MKKTDPKVASFLARVFEGSLSVSKIKEYVLKKYYQLNTEPQKIEGIDSELFELKTNLADLGWIGLDELIQIKKINEEDTNRSNVYQWIENLKHRRIIDRGIIAKGTGANLDWLDEKNEELNGFTAMSLESILRIVEVKRKKIINSYSQELTRDEKILEGLKISILLSRASRRHNDLRYLNAALKMNDWFFQIFRSVVTGKLLIYYLLALTEQEKSAAELLR